MAKKSIAAAGVVLATLLVWACERAPVPAPVMEISVRQLGGGEWRFSYRLSAPVEALAFGEPVNDFRAGNWTIETPGLRLVSDDAGETVTAGSGPFSTVEITMRETAMTVQKNYQPFYPFSDGGVLLYTGHFTPNVLRKGKITPVVTRFEFMASPGSSVLAFGERATRVVHQAQGEEHPFFVYFGQAPIVVNDAVAAVVDPETPDWIKREVQTLIPRIFDHLHLSFGMDLPRTPNFFLVSQLDAPRSGFSFNGDALASQFQVTLSGDGWALRSQAGSKILALHLAHEAAHLWQNLAQPIDEDQPEWIHEGGADAIAAETLVALGLWTREQAAEAFADAGDECARLLRGGALNSAAARGEYRALYACGQVMAVAAARAEGGGASVTDFWRALISRAGEEGGYSEALFFALVEERTGRPDLARVLRRFAATPLADPDREITQLLAVAGEGPEPGPSAVSP